jgi:hypothetical protein
MSFSAPSSYAQQDSSRSALVQRFQPTPAQAAAAAATGAVAPPERRRGRLILPFVLALLILLGTTGYGLLRPQNHAHTSPSAPGQPGSLVWGDGLFANRQELSAWLHQHGMSFARFARNHPAALKLVP